ncbi:hypothetical protein Taro_036617 [Colocasia esculenta]|uniref:GDSL esterase/lipase EXL3 n=1 Tax=Colocasia esculenta TaxID=4460 RepID=A0A843WAB4_COLES|nr:hypothetical protein [Colocasia esculenta]
MDDVFKRGKGHDVGMHHRSIKERRKKRKLTSNSGAKCQTLKEDMGIHIIPERGVLVLSSTLFFFLVFQSQLLLLLALSSPTNSSSPQVPALIVFGDSIVDPGNNNYIKTIVKCNFPPYGQDFAGGVPTGRFCNGKIPSDFLAAKLGVKEYLPAYVGVELSPEDILTGVSFASGGAGYDPLTAKLVSVISMSDQLELLKEYKQKMIAVAGEKKAAAILSEALYGVCCGTDDIANTYFGTPFRITHYDIPSYVDLMVDSATSFLEDLIKLGARKIAFVGLPPIGCVPSQRTLAGGIARDWFSLRRKVGLVRIKTKVDGLGVVCVSHTSDRTIHDGLGTPKRPSVEPKRWFRGKGRSPPGVDSALGERARAGSAAGFIAMDRSPAEEDGVPVLAEFLPDRPISRAPVYPPEVGQPIAHDIAELEGPRVLRGGRGPPSI